MELKKWIIVFDLDDTLYLEKDYLFSGISFVEEYITYLYGISFNGQVLNAYRNGVKDIWGWACEKIGLPLEVKESFLWLYRNHSPKITLCPGILELINELNQSNAKVIVLTDGRSISQRLKMKSLNLDHIPLYISEEYSSIKPDKKRFLLIQNKWKGSKFAYIGDNPNKDFIAPKELNWLCVGADWCKDKIHNEIKIDKKTEPDLWIKEPRDLIKVLNQHNY